MERLQRNISLHEIVSFFEVPEFLQEQTASQNEVQQATDRPSIKMLLEMLS